MRVNKDVAFKREKKKAQQKGLKWHRIRAFPVWHTANPVSLITTSSKSIKSIGKEENSLMVCEVVHGPSIWLTAA